MWLEEIQVLFLFVHDGISMSPTLYLEIIRTVVRIVGMGRMSHICNTKCSRL